MTINISLTVADDQSSFATHSDSANWLEEFDALQRVRDEINRLLVNSAKCPFSPKENSE